METCWRPCLSHGRESSAGGASASLSQMRETHLTKGVQVARSWLEPKMRKRERRLKALVATDELDSSSALTKAKVKTQKRVPEREIVTAVAGPQKKRSSGARQTVQPQPQPDSASSLQKTAWFETRAAGFGADPTGCGFQENAVALSFLLHCCCHWFCGLSVAGAVCHPERAPILRQCLHCCSHC